KGEFLVLDLGGSKCKVLQVKVSERKRRVEMEKTFFNLQKKHITQKREPMGFTFSFPCGQSKVDEVFNNAA
ncbi:unnamed protein product, partial [Coregonus sp. 'balchen']